MGSMPSPRLVLFSTGIVVASEVVSKAGTELTVSRALGQETWFPGMWEGGDGEPLWKAPGLIYSNKQYYYQ